MKHDQGLIHPNRLPVHLPIIIDREHCCCRPERGRIETQPNRPVVH